MNNELSNAPLLSQNSMTPLDKQFHAVFWFFGTSLAAMLVLAVAFSFIG